MKKMRLNKDLCVGCRYCEIICSIEHSSYGIVNTKKARIHIVTDAREGIDYPIVCQQCPKPLCMAACKFDAISVTAETGAMKIDYDKCTGCMECSRACPFHAVREDIELGTPLICDLCGGDPKCIKSCRVLPHIGKRAINYVEPSEWKPTPRKSIKVVGDLQG